MRRSVLLALTAVASAVVGGASLAAEPPAGTTQDDQGLYEVQAAALSVDEDVDGRLEALGERDLFVTRIETPLTLVQVLVRHEERGCTLDATLVDIDGTAIASAAAFAGQPQTVTALTGAAGPVFAVVEAHDARCAGVPYTLGVDVHPVGLTEPADDDLRVGRQVALISSGEPMFECYIWSQRWERLSELVRRTSDALRKATGERRARLMRKRRDLRRKLATARAHARSSCGRLSAP